MLKSSKSVDMIRMSQMLAGCLALAAIGGCHHKDADETSLNERPFNNPKVEASRVDAGLPLGASNDMTRWSKLYMARKYTPRTDPFALMPIEENYERRQQAERFLGEQGGFQSVLLDPPDDTDTTVAPEVEPQPHRRLAGILYGESVLAIIDMGDGRALQIVRPGQKVPGSEWTVVSIDQEKAILHRGGRKLPHEVVVRLESKT
jgi:hypothetical protein